MSQWKTPLPFEGRNMSVLPFLPHLLWNYGVQCSAPDGHTTDCLLIGSGEESIWEAEGGRKT